MATIFKPEEEKDKEGVNTLSTGPVAQASASPMAPMAQSSAGQPKGSGRFTNLQKYIDANQGGGQQLAGGIGKGIQEKVDENKNKAQDYYSKVAQGIQQGQQTAQQGSQYLNQLQGIGSNIKANTGADKLNNRSQSMGIEEFVQDPGFANYQNIQAGRGINENELALQQTNLGQAAKGYLDTTSQGLQNLGSESGRFNLLKQTYGGNVNPQYSVGQQRLDQLFLSNEGLQPLQQNLQGELKQAQNLNRQAGQSDSKIGNLIRQEQQLLADYGTTNQANEQAYVDMLSSYIPAINEQRGAEWQGLEDALSQYRTPPASGQAFTGLTPEQLQRLGVTKETGAYNVLENLIGANDIATRGADAASYKDVANTQDVARYNALAQIMGMSPEQKRITQESQIGDAYTSRTDEGALSNRFSAADTEFNRMLDSLGYNRSFQTAGGLPWTSSASGRGLFESGSDAITSGAAGYKQYQGLNDIYGNLKDQATGVWSDFEKWLGDQGFSRTIGGVNQQGSGYGQRYAPYEMDMSNMPIPDKLGNEYVDPNDKGKIG